MTPVASPWVPRVAVIVPVFNGQEMIADCVESLLKLDYPADALDVIVVDNRSTDRTREILAAYPVRVLSESTVQSSYAARNFGAAATDAEVLAFTDADCVVEHGWLRMLVHALEPATVGGVAGGIRAANVRTPIERYQMDRCIVAERAYAHPVLPFAQTANAGYKRAVFERLGGFDASIVYGGDLDFSWRMQRETGLELAYEACALVWHQHRSSPTGLFKLYAKNTIGDCLLAERYDHYAAVARARTLLYLTREAARSGWRATRAALIGTRTNADADWFDAVRYAGAAWGWLRFRIGGARAQRRLRPGLGMQRA